MLEHIQIRRITWQACGVQAAGLWRGHAKAALRHHDLGALAAVNASHDEGITP